MLDTFQCVPGIEPKYDSRIEWNPPSCFKEMETKRQARRVLAMDVLHNGADAPEIGSVTIATALLAA